MIRIPLLVRGSYLLGSSCRGGSCGASCGFLSSRSRCATHAAATDSLVHPLKLVEANGSSVVNDANETIGKIDDLLVTRDGKQPYAVLSIGGFLGLGTRMVVVRYDSLKFADKKILLPGGSKDGLKMLPAFEYSKE